MLYMHNGWTIPLIITVSPFFSSCSNIYDGVTDDTAVRLTVSVPNSASSKVDEQGTETRAISSSNENAIESLLVLIFNSEGDVIGYNYGSYSLDSNGQIAVTVNTRKATGCTVYVIGNAHTTTSMGDFSNVRTLSDFENLSTKITSASSLGDGSCLPMFGKITSFDTTKSGSVTLNHIESKFNINIVVGSGITLDSYQLCHVPLSAYYIDTKTAPSVPSGTSYGNFSAVSSTATNATVTSTYYTLESLVGKGSNSNINGWKGRYASKAPSDATYLLINAHTPTWKSTYRIYLGGKQLTSETNTSYDYTDYSIYRNTAYNVTVNLSGSGMAEDGCRVSFNSKIYDFTSSTTLTAWGSNSQGVWSGIESIDLGLSVKWANYNLGASTPEGAGKYYAWASTVGYYATDNFNFNWANTPYCTNPDESTISDKSSWSKYTTDNAQLEAKDDAATVELGSYWRIPTHEEWNELFDNCTREWTTQNGVSGCKFTASNGNSIFLPACGWGDGDHIAELTTGGWYWSSNLSAPDDVNHAWHIVMKVNSGTFSSSISGIGRKTGFSIRPVCTE